MEIEEKPAEGEEAKRWKDRCISGTYWDLNFQKYGPDEMIFPKSYSKWSSYIRNMTVRDDDVWVMSFPKCGTTWTQEMVWLLCNHLNFEEARKNYLEDRFPFLEIDAMYRIPPKWNGTTEENKPPTSMEIINSMPSPRFIKSHLPLSLLPKEIFKKKAKIIYVTRNPKDAMVSYYHHNVLIPGYTGTLDEFAETMISDNAIYSPFWPNVKGFHDLHLKNHPNLLFLTYEEMKSDLKSVILKTAKFLETKDITKDNLEKLEKHLSFSEMKNNPSVNWERISQAAFMGHNIPARTQFMRKGEVGSWKKEMSQEWIAKFDQWMKDNQIPGLFENV